MNNPVETFFAAWSVDDAEARDPMIAAALAPDAQYADPRTDTPLTGPDDISAYVGMFAQSAPGATASVAKSDQIQALTRATVEFRMADGMVQHGQYFIETEAGRITRMTGFVGTGTPE